MTEQWRPVPGFEGSYEVSDHGRVRSVDRLVPYRDGNHRRRKGQILAGRLDPDGRPTVSLRKSPPYRARVQRLVLEAFVGPAPEGTVCCHNDGDPTNNRLSNLRWDTMTANQLDAVRHGTHWNARKTQCSKGHPLVGDHVRLRLRDGSIRRDCLACRRTEGKKPREVES
jgi:hypothetical protein